MNLLSNLILFFAGAYLIAVTAFVYSSILTRPGEIFAWLYLKLDILFNNDRRACRGLGHHPVFKAIIGCSKCVSGQMSFWIFLAFNWKEYTSVSPIIALICHALFCGFTIYLSLIVKSTYKKNHE